MADDLDNVSVLKTGLILEKTGAIVLKYKPGVYDNTEIVLCVWAQSTHDPFVVWTYIDKTGACESGDYFNDLGLALQRFDERTW